MKTVSISRSMGAKTAWKTIRAKKHKLSLAAVKAWATRRKRK